MATYTTTPFTTDLLTKLTRATDVVAAGAADVTGSSGTVHVIHFLNAEAAVRYVSLFDSSTVSAGSADIVIPIDALGNMAVFIDDGVAFGTAISVSASNNPDGVGNPVKIDINIMSHDF